LQSSIPVFSFSFGPKVPNGELIIVHSDGRLLELSARNSPTVLSFPPFLPHFSNPMIRNLCGACIFSQGILVGTSPLFLPRCSKNPPKSPPRPSTLSDAASSYDIRPFFRLKDPLVFRAPTEHFVFSPLPPSSAPPGHSSLPLTCAAETALSHSFVTRIKSTPYYVVRSSLQRPPAVRAGPSGSNPPSLPSSGIVDGLDRRRSTL